MHGDLPARPTVYCCVTEPWAARNVCCGAGCESRLLSRLRSRSGRKEELADLLAEAGCKGAWISAEHFCREHLAVWDPPRGRVGLAYTMADVQRVTRLLAERDVMVSMELLLGLPGETLETVKRAIDESLRLPTVVVGYTPGLQVFPHTPLGIRLAAESAGRNVVHGLQSNTATRPILLEPLERCTSLTEYERQFWFDEEGLVRPVFYFSPDLPEDPETIARPNGRWVNTIAWIKQHVPASEHYRVALPTLAGDGTDDNNYADNPFLQRAAALEYKGAHYSWWRRREEVMSIARSEDTDRLAGRWGFKERRTGSRK